MLTVALCCAAQWATFPLLLLAFQAGDLQGLAENRTVGASLHGASTFEKVNPEPCVKITVDFGTLVGLYSVSSRALDL